MTSIVHETLTFTQFIEAPVPAVWVAFADSTQRAIWSVPAGEVLVYDQSNFRVGRRDEYRCGPPQTLGFHGVNEYLEIRPESLIVHTDVVTTGDQTLAVALLTWEFDDSSESTVVRLTDQLTSFVGTDMIDGHRNGHSAALKQLRDFVEAAERAL